MSSGIARMGQKEHPFLAAVQKRIEEGILRPPVYWVRVRVAWADERECDVFCLNGMEDLLRQGQVTWGEILPHNTTIDVRAKCLRPLKEAGITVYYDEVEQKYEEAKRAQKEGGGNGASIP